MLDNITLGLIGAGRIGQVHGRNLCCRTPGTQILAVADPAIERAGKLAEELNIPTVTADARSVLENPDIQAVLVCSSTDTHAELVIGAARAGKHIFCEKPLDLDLESIDRMLTEVERAGVKLQLGFNRRFDYDFMRIQELVAEGVVGEPHILRITSRDPAPPQPEYIHSSGGLFLDMTIHDFDMARFVLDAEVEELYVAAAVLIDPAIGAQGDVDTAVVTLRFDNGCLGVIDNSRRSIYGYDQRIEIFGSRGRVSNRNHGQDTVALADACGWHNPPPLAFFMERYHDAYEAELKAFIDCVRYDRDPDVDGEAGRKAVQLGHAAKLSLAENRPVKLSEIARSSDKS